MTSIGPAPAIAGTHIDAPRPHRSRRHTLAAFPPGKLRTAASGVGSE